MSTFRGIVKEFPEIRIDYFRPVDNGTPPLAHFLSHVHSDHLQGLESFKGRFVYCSPATREILLRLEKYPHRMNFAKGVLESRVQTYRHLKNLLKAIPLETPTIIELGPEKKIRVTLFDANHCVGAVMFLVEGDGKAILYTGDIRSEPWWVNNLIRNPVLLPYAECIKTLDCIYLDTTFASKSDRYREFPSKRDGLRELTKKVNQYPHDTVFYMESWTFGYEDVWIALSALLESQVHLDPYRWSLYRSLAAVSIDAPQCVEAGQLCGFKLGNHHREGCLTADPTARIHSCERGTACPTMRGNEDVVRIVPIVSRLSNGVEMQEVGIGGGKSDLDQIHELEVNDATALQILKQLCATRIEDEEKLEKILALLNVSSRVNLGLDLDGKLEQDEVRLEDLVEILSGVTAGDADGLSDVTPSLTRVNSGGLPKTITFPYSRHSSYSELCCLVDAFKPKDVHPCTVDEATWTPEVSIHSLFGHFCSEVVFAHDEEMMELFEERRLAPGPAPGETQQETQRSHATISSTSESTQPTELAPVMDPSPVERSENPTSEGDRFFTPPDPGPSSSPPVSSDAVISHISTSTAEVSKKRAHPPSSSPDGTWISPPPRSRKIRKWAFLAASGEDTEVGNWDAFGGLQCVKSTGGNQESQEL